MTPEVRATFRDRQIALSLFAEAIAGYPVALLVVDETEDGWPWQTTVQRGTNVALRSELWHRNAFRTIILHRLLVDHSVLESPHRAIFGAAYLLVEDLRINALISHDYPGAPADLLRLQQQVLHDLQHDPAPTATPLHPALVALRWHGLGASRADLDARFPGRESLITAIIELCAQLTRPGATALDSKVIATRIVELLESNEPESMLEQLGAELAAESDAPALPTDDPGGTAVEGGTPSEFEDAPGVSGGQLLSEAPEHAAVTVPDAESEKRPRAGLQLPRWTRARSPLERTFVYDEWDYHEQQHRRSWCQVREEHLWGDDHEFITEVRTRHAALRARLRRRLAQMRPDDLVRVHRSDDGDELDIDAAIEAIVDRRSGVAMEERLHIRRDRAARDVATAFLIDLSASTSSPAVPQVPEPIPADQDPFDDPMSYGPLWGSPPTTEAPRRVIDVAKDAVALMGDALNEIGDRFAIYGFSGTGRENVEFKVGKEFRDAVSATTWASVAAMKPLRYTRMGPAVRHAAAKLLAEPARSRQLIVLSDGYPQDIDYGLDRHDRDYGMHDTARALSDAAHAGIETFCLTIDPAGHDYLGTMLPPHRYVVIDDVESLPEELANLYLRRTAR